MVNSSSELGGPVASRETPKRPAATPWNCYNSMVTPERTMGFTSVHLSKLLVLESDTLPGTNMEVEKDLFVLDFMVFQGAILHFHVSSRECILYSLSIKTHQFRKHVREIDQRSAGREGPSFLPVLIANIHPQSIHGADIYVPLCTYIGVVWGFNMGSMYSIYPTPPSTSSEGIWTLQTHPSPTFSEGTWKSRDIYIYILGPGIFTFVFGSTSA